MFTPTNFLKTFLFGILFISLFSNVIISFWFISVIIFLFNFLMMNIEICKSRHAAPEFMQYLVFSLKKIS